MIAWVYVWTEKKSNTTFCNIGPSERHIHFCSLNAKSQFNETILLVNYTKWCIILTHKNIQIKIPDCCLYLWHMSTTFWRNLRAIFLVKLTLVDQCTTDPVWLRSLQWTSFRSKPMEGCFDHQFSACKGVCVCLWSDK